MLDLVSVNCPCLQILDKSQTGIFSISGFLVKPFIAKTCQNSRTSDDVNMKLGPLTKPDKTNKTTSKKLIMRLCRQIMASLVFFKFVVNLEQSGSRILDGSAITS